MSSDSDDVWASSDDDLAEYDRAIAQKEWDKLNINHGNVTCPESVRSALQSINTLWYLYIGGLQGRDCRRQRNEYAKRF